MRNEPRWQPVVSRAIFIAGILAILISGICLSGDAVAGNKDEDIEAHKASIEAGRTEATAIDGQVKRRFGSPEGLKNNAAVPLMSETPLTTLDEKKSFSSQISSPSSQEFLTVFIKPGLSGDLETVLITQDTDLDGKADYSYSLPMAPSGVCANGVIVCEAGSWKNCKYFRWEAPGGRVKLAPTPTVELGGCYCINNSCISNLALRNLTQILRDLGGGTVGAVVASDAKYAITDAKVENTTITYFGQDT